MKGHTWHNNIWAQNRFDNIKSLNYDKVIDNFEYTVWTSFIFNKCEEARLVSKYFCKETI